MKGKQTIVSNKKVDSTKEKVQFQFSNIEGKFVDLRFDTK